MASSTSQPPGVPDELERIRRERGEGWDWPRIQVEPCPQCGYNPAAVPPASLGERLVGLSGEWGDFLQKADDSHLRTNPGPGIFSPMQYGAHVRNILMIAGDRMLLGLSQDNPVAPGHSLNQDEWESYNRLDPGELAVDLDSQARRLAGIMAGVGPSDWSRTIVNDRGRDGVYTFSIRGLACNAVHEAHHHLLDADGTLGVEGRRG
jgi:hypothetical protein